MTISRSDLEKICNYTECKKPIIQQQGAIYYIENISSEDDWIANEIKRKKRQNNIDLILDEKSEEVNELDWPGSVGELEITTRVMTQNVNVVKFTNLESLYNDVLSHIDKITSSNMKTWTQGTLDIKLLSHPNMTINDNTGKIITKIMMLSNLISMNSRLGHPKTMIVGNKIYEYLISSNYTTSMGHDEFINGINITRSDLINTNKVILIKTTPGQSGGGLNVINNTSVSSYFMAETPTFEKYISWFEII